MIPPLEFAWRALVCALELVVVAWTAARLARRYDPPIRAVAFGVIASAVICLPALVLGALGWLGLPTVLATHLALLAIALRTTSRPTDETPSPGPAPRDPFLAIAAGLGCAAVAYVAMRALLLPPLAWDSLEYHLPLPIEWMQSGRLAPAYFADNPYPGYYPGTAELLALFLLLPWRNDLLVGLMSLPMIVLGGVAVHRIALQAGVAPRLARYAPWLYVLTPCVARLAATQYVDPTLSAWLLSSLAAFLAYRGSRTQRDLLLTCLAAGLCVGCRYTGPLLLLPILAGTAWTALRYRPRPWGTLAIGAAVLALGGFWYWRNWFVAGSPTYPAEVRLLGVTLFAGVPQTMGGKILDNGMSILSTFRTIAADGSLVTAIIGSPRFLYNVGYLMGIGPKAFPLALLVVMAGGLLVWRRGSPSAAAWVIGSCLWFTFCFLASPYYWPQYLPHVIRYATPAVALAAVTAVVIASWWHAREWQLALFCFLCVAGDVAELVMAMPPSARHPWALLALGLAAGWIAWRRALPTPGSRVARALVVAIVVAIGPALYALHQYREANRYAAYTNENEPAWTASFRFAAGWAWLDKETARLDHPARIAWNGQNLIYPLYGPRLDRRVRYVDINREAYGAFHAYPPGGMLANPDPQAWIENLRREQIDLVVLQRDDMVGAWPIEATWADQNPTVLSPGYLTTYTRAYRVRR